MSNYSVEEVRARINKAWQNHDAQGRVFLTMGDAMALVETILPRCIAADEGAAIGEVRTNGVTWFRDNPHAYPIGTRFYAAPPVPPAERVAYEVSKMCQCLTEDQRRLCVDRDKCCHPVALTAAQQADR